MKKKLWSLFATVLVCTASFGNSPDETQKAEMERVIAIVSDRLQAGLQASSHDPYAYWQEAAVCLNLLAKTVYSGDVCIAGMTWNGLDFLYQEVRAQKNFILSWKMRSSYFKCM